ncbi:aspartic proteinase 36 isoform X2 [Ricinus communis]|uniref:Aspartic proteinase Asp1, putative n=1 Tax=Ricinus communis TaxID=3988 RepID=B9S098_RICCO|nr:aspartic proteinase 36 isoform X2 [Ricinus communis]EEF42831.1 Aspartic proteinase Asp1 precursor, putative [Ricinus communis]|eukprot:XP_002519417.1 aspartic proteinase-like protein 2 isoform X2 [Ricinus communis]
MQSFLPLLILSLSFLLVSVSFVYSATFLSLERALPLNQSFELAQLRARDHLRHARLLQGFVGGVVDFSVQGSSDPYLVGLYFTRVKLGTPPREFNVQIDTGSDVLWVTCSSCSNCPQTSGLGIQLNYFDTTSSSTARLVPCSHPICTSQIQTTATQCPPQSNQCSYAFQYGDGSGTSGYYVSDTFYFDAVLGESLIANSSAAIVFGCSTYQSGDLTKTDKAVDGIFGFGQGELSVISQLSSHGITPRVFSHCLKGEDSGGGILVLGEILEPGIVYSPLVPSQPHYNLDLQSIAVSGQLLPIDPAAFATSSNRGTIIDTGTTLAYLVEEAYDPFVSAITAAVSQLATPTINKGNQCYLVSNSVSEVFPPVSFNFAGGATMLLKPEEYLMYLTNYAGAALWCIGFQKIQGGITILGDLVLKDKIFVYDLAHQRIGWANYDCSSSVNVSVTSSKDFINAGQLSVSSSSKDNLLKLLPLSSVALLMHILLALVNFQFL